MANQVTMSGSITYADGVTTLNSPTFATPAIGYTCTNPLILNEKVSIATTPGTAIPLGANGCSLAFGFFVNVDPTNYIELKTATGGTLFARLQPNGGWAAFQFSGSGTTAPFAIANSSAALLQVYLFGP